MPPVRPLSYREVVRKLRRAGFAEVSQKDSHVKFARATDAGVLTVIVPRHREIAAGTLRSIVRQAGLTFRAFDAM
ncbi:MAG: type II toxin-antitoxin system HicA family toxin [Dehalococcoidia bacterium]|nr:type II toxin-antitoxin system HicA family toxin [Dehalococcoidia bacterium]